MRAAVASAPLRLRSSVAMEPPSTAHSPAWAKRLPRRARGQQRRRSPRQLRLLASRRRWPLQRLRKGSPSREVAPCAMRSRSSRRSNRGSSATSWRRRSMDPGWRGMGRWGPGRWESLAVQSSPSTPSRRSSQTGARTPPMDQRRMSLEIRLPTRRRLPRRRIALAAGRAPGMVEAASASGTGIGERTTDLIPTRRRSRSARRRAPPTR